MSEAIGSRGRTQPRAFPLVCSTRACEKRAGAHGGAEGFPPIALSGSTARSVVTRVGSFPEVWLGWSWRQEGGEPASELLGADPGDEEALGPRRGAGEQRELSRLESQSRGEHGLD